MGTKIVSDFRAEAGLEGHSNCGSPVVLIDYNEKKRNYGVSYAIRFSNYSYARRFAESNHGSLSEPHLPKDVGKETFEKMHHTTVLTRPVMTAIAVGVLLFFLLGFSTNVVESPNAPIASNVATSPPEPVVMAAPPPVQAPPPPVQTPPAIPLPIAPELPRAQPLPPNGRVWIHTSDEPEAPFSVETQAGGDNYLVRLKDAQTNRTIVEAFIRSGMTLRTKVPLGNYRVYWASGPVWYGNKKHFGPNASFGKTGEAFNFYVDEAQNMVMGHRMTLYTVPGGNLRTQTANAQEFD